MIRGWHLAIPRDREGRYYPSLLRPYARRMVDLGEVAVALYAAGLSQRKAAEVMSLLLGHRYSHETLSTLTDEVLEAAEAFRRRPLPEEMAFVYLDGLVLKVLREGEGVVRETVYGSCKELCVRVCAQYTSKRGTTPLGWTCAHVDGQVPIGGGPHGT
ncbi:transposase, partial [Thermus scotoductus]|uniref:transposase n=1 Tax=Thermus scotoductus TaxID=37636 RepID=UPI003F5183CC